MSESFPLRPDSVWYELLVARYGDAVPPLEHLQVRRGLQGIVEDLFDKLADADRFRSCRIHGIVTRNAGFVVIDARFGDRATEADKRMCNSVLERIQERLGEACEHFSAYASKDLRAPKAMPFGNPACACGSTFFSMRQWILRPSADRRA